MWCLDWRAAESLVWAGKSQCGDASHCSPDVLEKRGDYRHVLPHLVSLSTRTVILVTVLPSLLYSKEYCRTDLQSLALSKVHTLFHQAPWFEALKILLCRPRVVSEWESDSPKGVQPTPTGSWAGLTAWYSSARLAPRSGTCCRRWDIACGSYAVLFTQRS